MNYYLVTVDKLLDDQHLSFCNNWKLDTRMLGLSGCLVLQHHTVISEIAPCEGSSHFSLPKEYNGMIY